ncbi:unnamed protein product [Haemonchus placei]|uniref:Uncharacterized protein n=1 Tax=Haemonchus placei TaxID=6290 RepID=A0A0N4X9I7_HAEPC|nr:unnamed protein product [Haemonchus placei]
MSWWPHYALPAASPFTLRECGILSQNGYLTCRSHLTASSSPFRRIGDGSENANLPKGLLLKLNVFGRGSKSATSVKKRERNEDLCAMERRTIDLNTMGDEFDPPFLVEVRCQNTANYERGTTDTLVEQKTSTSPLDSTTNCEIVPRLPRITLSWDQEEARLRNVHVTNRVRRTQFIIIRSGPFFWEITRGAQSG